MIGAFRMSPMEQRLGTALPSIRHLTDHDGGRGDCDWCRHWRYMAGQPLDDLPVDGFEDVLLPGDAAHIRDHYDLSCARCGAIWERMRETAR